MVIINLINIVMCLCLICYCAWKIFQSARELCCLDAQQHGDVAPVVVVQPAPGPIIDPVPPVVEPPVVVVVPDVAPEDEVVEGAVGGTARPGGDGAAAGGSGSPPTGVTYPLIRWEELRLNSSWMLQEPSRSTDDAPGWLRTLRGHRTPGLRLGGLAPIREDEPA